MKGHMYGTIILECLGILGDQEGFARVWALSQRGEDLCFIVYMYLFLLLLIHGYDVPSTIDCKCCEHV